MSNVDPSSDRFEIGGENLIPKIGSVESGSEEPVNDVRKGDDGLDDIRVRIGTLLKTETVSLLFGAGASGDCGGQLIGAIPLAIEQALEEEGITGQSTPRIRRWLLPFYLALRHSSGGGSSPVTRDAILGRRQQLNGNSASPLKVNFEHVLAQLHRWRVALPAAGGR